MTATAQIEFKNYELIPAPDLWYNSVDGVRVGVRLKGQVPGSFNDGPHRLDFGLWLGTNFPEDPVSYYLSYTEPLASSSFGDETAVRLISSIRTGYHHHGIGLQRRYQKGFNERVYNRGALFAEVRRRYDLAYAQFIQLWQTNWLSMLRGEVEVSRINTLGRMITSHHFALHVPEVLGADGYGNTFLRYQGDVQQQWEISELFSIDGRAFLGIASTNTPPEYRFSRSMASAVDWMDRGLTRAEGTIPQNWLESGNIQVAGGPNLRGYLSQDIALLSQNTLVNPFNSIYLENIASVNLELNYPNPIDRYFSEIPIVGSFISMQSYLFFDAGTSLGLTANELDQLLADAGLGFHFTLNIPDYLGNPRGFMIRYDLPFWVSQPGNEQSFAFRNVLAIGAIISF